MPPPYSEYTFMTVMSCVADLCCTGTFCFCVTFVLCGTDLFLFLTQIVKFLLNLKGGWLSYKKYFFVEFIKCRIDPVWRNYLWISCLTTDICKFSHIILVLCIKWFIVLFHFLLSLIKHLTNKSVNLHKLHAYCTGTALCVCNSRSLFHTIHMQMQ